MNSPAWLHSPDMVRMLHRASLLDAERDALPDEMVYLDDVGQAIATERKKPNTAGLTQIQVMAAVRAGRLRVIDSRTQLVVAPADLREDTRFLAVEQDALNAWLAEQRAPIKRSSSPNEVSAPGLPDVVTTGHRATPLASVRGQVDAERRIVIMRAFRERFGDLNQLPFFPIGSHEGDPALRVAMAALPLVSRAKVRELVQALQRSAEVGPKNRQLRKGDPRLSSDPAP